VPKALGIFHLSSPFPLFHIKISHPSKLAHGRGVQKYGDLIKVTARLPRKYPVNGVESMDATAAYGYPARMSAQSDFISLSICVLTVSDTRNTTNDTSGDYLVKALTAEGHRLFERALLPDERYRLRAVVSRWIAEPEADGILVTGGTGFTARDSTPEALLPLLDKQMPGFGELFRAVSFEEIGTSSLQSRAFAGLANATFLFALPGSTSACTTAWTRIIRQQLDSRTRPCNLATLRPRL